MQTSATGQIFNNFISYFHSFIILLCKVFFYIVFEQSLKVYYLFEGLFSEQVFLQYIAQSN